MDDLTTLFRVFHDEVLDVEQHVLSKVLVRFRNRHLASLTFTAGAVHGCHGEPQRDLDGKETRRRVVAHAHLRDRRHRLAAFFLHVPAPRCEAAAGRRVDQVGRASGDRPQLASAGGAEAGPRVS